MDRRQAREAATIFSGTGTVNAYNTVNMCRLVNTGMR
jgi:hypothetical protein